MRKLFAKMWNDDAGIVAFEYLLVATIVGLSLVVGLSAISVALNSEMTELANAILVLNQSYSVVAQSSCVSAQGGSQNQDAANGINYGHSAFVPLTNNVQVGSNTNACP